MASTPRSTSRAMNDDAFRSDPSARGPIVAPTTPDVKAAGENAADGSLGAAAAGLDTAASAVRNAAGDLPGGARVRTVAHATADRLGAGADYIRNHDAKRVMADVEGLLKSNPGTALLAAAAFGFLLGRTLSRD